VQGYACR